MMGFASHAPLLYQGLTPVENLRFFGRLSGVADAERRARGLLDRLGLTAFADQPMSHFSRGMLQRVALSRAILPEPRVLILDEPYAGLDDEGVRVVNELILESRSRKAATLLVAHDHERAAPVTTRRFRMHRGRCEHA
jgi:heme exporter protein A